MTGLALPASRRTRRGWRTLLARDDGRKLAEWLLIWVVLPNAGFALLWLFGGPPRYHEILLTGVVGFALRRSGYWVQASAYVALLGYSLVRVIAGIFNLALASLIDSLRFFGELSVETSWEYLLSAALIALFAIGGLVRLRRDTGFADPAAACLAILTVAALAGVDYRISEGMRGHYMRDAPTSAPFASAVQQSDLVAPALANRRNVLVVMVESLGAPLHNAEMQRLLFARYRDPAVTARFEVSRGETPYFNSTTSGEVRELCGHWGDYFDLVDSQDSQCLPARLRDVGYGTSAWHSFAGDLFDRRQWYPNAGFETQLFADDLARTPGVGRCGGVFAGVCDRDIPALLGERLRQAEEPQFIYWLTVNTHLPVPHGNNLRADDCASLSPALARDFPMACRQFAVWDQIDRALVGQLTATDFPPTDVLIVGDHMPPYFDRHTRAQFAPDRVPWLLLRWRNEAGR